MKDSELNRIQLAYLIQLLEDKQDEYSINDRYGLDERALIQLMINKLNAQRGK